MDKLSGTIANYRKPSEKYRKIFETIANYRKLSDDRIEHTYCHRRNYLKLSETIGKLSQTIRDYRKLSETIGNYRTRSVGSDTILQLLLELSDRLGIITIVEDMFDLK